MFKKYISYFEKSNHNATLSCKINAGHHLSYRELLVVRAVICDLGTYGDFSIEYDNNNNKSNFDLKRNSNTNTTTTTTNAFRIFLTFTVWTAYRLTWLPCYLLLLVARKIIYYVILFSVSIGTNNMSTYVIGMA